MITYNISYSNPHRHYVDFELIANTNGVDKMYFQLAAWRPGRYELANFAQNIRNWKVKDDNGSILNFQKITKDLWQVNTKNIQKICVTYSFYANKLDAGSCYLDEYQLYLNPVHCCFYIVDRMQEKYKLNFDLPKDYKIASSLLTQNTTLTAKNYDELAESPIICSNALQYDFYEVDNIKFHLWFQGRCNLNWKKLKNDFTLFTKSQINHFGEFPVDEYHFIFQITPYKSYHGVEHTKNTVLLLGPAEDIMDKRYEDLLGVCSHELYHTWNIKAIRPKEMLPYNYTKENYFRTGFVAEGVTTYMGDLMLYNSSVFNWDEFIKTQNQNLERHLMNYGRYNLSVADSGFDNWLDGYKIGAPDRKVSIYPDGALCMLMIDLEIIHNTNGKSSLHTVMKDLYNNFALKGKGYSEEDFQNICLKYGGDKVMEVFKKHIYGTENYIPTINSALKLVGLELVRKKNSNSSAQFFGFISIKENGKEIIKKIEPESIADTNGMGPEDEIIKVNGKLIKGNLNKSFENINNDVELTFKNKFSKKTMTFKKGNYYQLLEIKKVKRPSENQILLRKKWLS